MKLHFQLSPDSYIRQNLSGKVIHIFFSQMKVVTNFDTHMKKESELHHMVIQLTCSINKMETKGFWLNKMLESGCFRKEDEV